MGWPEVFLAIFVLAAIGVLTYSYLAGPRDFTGLDSDLEESDDNFDEG